MCHEGVGGAGGVLDVCFGSFEAVLLFLGDADGPFRRGGFLGQLGGQLAVRDEGVGGAGGVGDVIFGSLEAVVLLLGHTQRQLGGQLAVRHEGVGGAGGVVDVVFGSLQAVVCFSVTPGSWAASLLCVTKALLALGSGAASSAAF